MGRVRITRPFVLLALAALLAPRIEASRTSVWESNRPAALTATRADAAGQLASLAPAQRLDTSTAADSEIVDSPRFDLGDVVLVESALEHDERFGLGPLDPLGPTPLRGPPPSYPETRVRGFELLPPFRVGASPTLSLWPRQACGSISCELASDGPQDPWGLQAAEGEEPVDQDWADAAGVWADTRARQERGLNAGKRAAGYVGQGLDVATDFAPGIGLAKIPQFFIAAYERGGRAELMKMGLSFGVVTAIVIALTHRTPVPGVKFSEEELALSRRAEASLGFQERSLAEKAAELEAAGKKGAALRLSGDSALVARVRAKLALYPHVVDPRSGRAISFPSAIREVAPRAERVAWGTKERGEFIAEWYRRGYETPRGGWANYDIHHIQPREFGGTNDFWNLVPVERGTHQDQLNAFWREFLGL